MGSVRQGWARAILLVSTVTLGGATASIAAPSETELTEQGKALVSENCSRCHAIGAEGVSPNPQAPPFRTLSSKYPVENLAESLAEGIVSGHPDMPVFEFAPQDVEAIIAYLESIQEAEPAEEPVPGSTPDE